LRSACSEHFLLMRSRSMCFFCDWHLSFSLTLLRLIYAVAGFSSLFLFFPKSNSTMCKWHVLFAHLSFHFLTIMNICAHVFTIVSHLCAEIKCMCRNSSVKWPEWFPKQPSQVAPSRA
jgi:hypothetical protein